MEALRNFLNDMTPTEQAEFAERSGTTIGYLRKALSTKETLREELVIAMDRESGGIISCEEMRPDVDWPYLRDKFSRLKTKRKTC